MAVLRVYSPCMKFICIAPGDYQSEDGTARMYRHIGVNPPAWTIESEDGTEVYVDGAASKRDAEAIYEADRA